MALRVLGVLAGEGTDRGFLERWARSADVVLAADGGADLLLRSGLVPQTTVGDLDSISDSARRRLPDVRYDSDQDSSDCDKLLALVRSLGHSSVTLIAASGTRIDHMFAVLQSSAKSGLFVRIAYERQLATVLVGPSSLTVTPVPGQSPISLLPLTVCKGVHLHGVRWTLSGATLDPLGHSSLSNLSIGPVRVAIGSGAAVLFHSNQAEPEWSDER